MTNYSTDSSNVVKRWYKNGCIYCAFIDGTVMEYENNKIPKRYIELMRDELTETVHELQNDKLTFDDLHPVEV